MGSIQETYQKYYIFISAEELVDPSLKNTISLKRYTDTIQLFAEGRYDNKIYVLTNYVRTKVKIAQR